jgi:hypothetical protein
MPIKMIVTDLDCIKSLPPEWIKVVFTTAVIGSKDDGVAKWPERNVL